MRTRLSVLFTVVLLAGVLATPVASANGVPIEEIYEDTTLAEDHFGGIAVKDSNVTLDCDGHSIIEDHVSDEGVGILIEGWTGVTVKDCVVIGFETGVHITGSNDIVVKNTTSLSEVYGFFVGGFEPEIPEYESHHVTVKNCTASGAMIFEGIGFLVEGGHDITLKNNVATGNWDNGFRVRGPSHHNLLVNNRAESNGSHGFEVHGYYDDGTGAVYEATSNLLRGNTAVDNGVIHGGSGFKIGEYATMNLLDGNHASQNRWAGFFLNEEANNNTLVKNRSFNNDWLGFWVSWYSTDNKLVRNLSMRNFYGFYAEDDSPGTLLDSNVFCNNEEANLGYDATSEPVLIGDNVCGVG